MATVWYLALLVRAAMAASILLDARTDFAQCESNTLFSCPADATCIPTTPTNSSVICCPKGAQCTLIQPLVCDVSQQDASKYPDNLVHTTNLTADLPKCGSSCCPFGYDCQGGMCVLKSVPSPTLTASSSPSPSTTTASSTNTSATSTPSAAPTAPATQPSPKPNIGLILGLTLGIIAALALILGIFALLKRRKRRNPSYVESVYGPRGMNDSDEDFMGTTPRPPDVPRESSPRRPEMADRNFTTVRGHISHPDFGRGAPLHRTDFLLRRGSVETGYEDKIKPSWSTRSRNRPKSKFLQSIRKSTASMPKTPETTRMPVFATPLRFGLPAGPKLTEDDPVNPHRPPKGEANLARLVNLGGKTVPSGAAIRVDNSTPPPSKAKKCEIRPRDRSESQRRPLVRDNSVERREEQTGPPGPAGTHGRGTSPLRSRSISDATTESFEIGSSDDEEDDKLDNANRVTMNVLLPPPSVFRTPPPTAREHHAYDESTPREHGGLKRQTTFNDLIRKAG